MTTQQWETEINRRWKEVPLKELMLWIDFEQLSQDLIKSRPLESEIFETIFYGQWSVRPEHAEPEPDRVLIAKVAHVKKGRSVPPHGHRNMVSSFLVVTGDWHVRQYHKVQDQADRLLIEKFLDERQPVGDWSTVSDHRNNVHWLKALSDDCFLFTIKIVKLDPDTPCAGRMHIDIDGATELTGSLLSAPKISYQEALNRY